MRGNMLKIEKPGYAFVAKRMAILVAVIALTLTGCAQSGVSATPTETPNQELSTPALIAQALAKGEITDEQRLLYLAYAVYEHESLPAWFRGSVGWRATSTVEELNEAVSSPSIFCSMSPNVRSEFQRLFEPDITCH
jgi:hypothetical protein